jgi:hypothetical protein
MNTSTNHFADLSPADRAFAQVAQTRLRASEVLDYTESARLAAARRRAVAALEERRSGIAAWLLAPAALATVALSFVLIPNRLVSPPTGASAVNGLETAALEWVVDEAGPDFYRDLEFYRWLEQQSELGRLPEPNA